MSLNRLMNQPLTVQALGSTALNSYGDQVVGPLQPAVAVLGFLQQLTSVEHLVDRDTSVTTWEAYLPGSTVISHLDFINFQGQQFQVDGEPWHVYNPRTKSVAYVACKLVVFNG